MLQVCKSMMAAWHHVLLVALGVSIVRLGAAQDVSLGGLAIEPMSVGTQMQDLSVFPASPVAGDTIYITGRLVRRNRRMQLPSNSMIFRRQMQSSAHLEFEHAVLS
jgi:hypothetical protein